LFGRLDYRTSYSAQVRHSFAIWIRRLYLQLPLSKGLIDRVKLVLRHHKRDRNGLKLRDHDDWDRTVGQAREIQVAT
jgi:hypothetical protein